MKRRVKLLSIVLAAVLVFSLLPGTFIANADPLPDAPEYVYGEDTAVSVQTASDDGGGADYAPVVEIEEDFSGHALNTQLPAAPGDGSYSLIGGAGTSQVVVDEDYDGDVITLRSNGKGRVGIKLKDDDIFSESEVWLDVRFNDIKDGDRQMEHLWDEFLVNTFWLDPTYGASIVLSDYTNQVTTKAWGTNTTTVAIDEEEGWSSKIVPDKWYSLRVRTFNRDGASSLSGNRDTNQTKIEFSFWDAEKSEPTFPMAARLVWFAHFNYDAGMHIGSPAVKAPLLVQNFIYTRYPDGGNSTLRNPTPSVWDSRDIHFRKTVPNSDQGARGSATSNATLKCGSLALYVDLFSDESDAEISIRNLRFTSDSDMAKYKSFDIRTDNIWDYFEPFDGMYNLNNGPNIWNNYGPKTEVTAANFFGIYNEWNQGHNRKVTAEGAPDPAFVGDGKNVELDSAAKKKVLRLDAAAGTASGITFDSEEYQNSILNMMVRFDAGNAMAGDGAGLYIAPVGDGGLGQNAALAVLRPHLSGTDRLQARSVKNGAAAASGNNFAVTAGRWYHVRVVTMESGSTGYDILGDANNYIRVKIWERGTPEPTSYQINHTYAGASVPAGNLAVYAAAGTGAASVTVADISMKAYANGELPQSSARARQLRLGSTNVESANETHIKNFDPDKFTYWHAEGRKDVAAVLANRGDAVTYTQATASPGTAYVNIRGLTGGASRYEIRFVASGRAIASIGVPEVTVRRGVDVSKNILPTTVPVTLADGDKFDAYVVWNHLEFDPNDPGEQIITGTLYPEAQRGVNVREQDAAKLKIVQRPIQAQLFISPDGSDSNNGSFARPFKTVQKARDYIKASGLSAGMTGDIVVYLRGGTYNITEPIEFGVGDSGTNGFSIVYQAYPGEKPEISGGYEFDAVWEPVAVNGVSAYKATLDRADKLRTLYVNGVKANWPTANIQGQYQIGKIEVTGEEFWAETPGWAWTHILVNKSNVPASNFRDGKFINPDDVEIWTQAAAWTANHTTIHDITPYETTFDATERARFQQMWTIPQNSTSYYALEVQQPYGAILSRLTCYCNSRAVNENTGTRRTLSVRNIFSAFGTSRGQYYFDKEMKTLYYYPRVGEDMSMASVVIPQSEGIIRVEGKDKESRVENLVFSGIKFSYDDYLLQRVDGGDPEKEATLLKDFGYVSRAWGGIQSIALQKTFRQEGSHHPAWYNNEETPFASVTVQSAKNILFEGNYFINLSSSSNIGFVNDVSDSGIIGNIFKDTAGNAIALGHPQHVFEGVDPLSDNQDFDAETVEAVTRNNKIMYNYIRNIGVDFDQGDAIMAFFVENTDICHNDVEKVPYTALCLGWGWWNFEGSTYSFTPGNPSLTAKTNRVLFNRFGDTNIIHTGDGGTVYTLGYQPDTFIAYNYLFRGRAMLYQDEGSTGLFIDRNVVQSGVGSGGSNWGNGLMTNDTVGREVFLRTNTYSIGAGDAALAANPAAQAIADNAGIRAPFDSVFALMETYVNKNVLENVIDEAESLKGSDYTTDSWAALTAALTAAKAVYTDAGAGAVQAQVDEAALALRTAIDALAAAVATPEVKGVVGIMSVAANGVPVRENTTELYIHFSNEVPGLTLADFTVAGATATGLAGGGYFYKLTIADITVPDQGKVNLSIDSGAYLFTPVSKTVTVYRYTVVTVSYDLNGGSGGGGAIPAPVVNFPGAPYTVAPADGLVAPSTSLLFKEWNTEADGSGTGFAQKSAATLPAEDTTLYAIWDQACTVTFSVVGGHGALKAAVEGIDFASGGRLVKGATVIFTAFPDNYYVVSAWTWNSLPVANKSRTYTLTLTGDADVTVAFEESGYALPENGLELRLTADEGVTTDAAGNVTRWENQVPGLTVALTPSSGIPRLMHDSALDYDYINFAAGNQMSGTFKSYGGASAMTIVAINQPTATGLNIAGNWADRANLMRIGNIGLVSTRRGTVVTFSAYASQTYALYDLGSDSINQVTTMVGMRSSGVDYIYYNGQQRARVTGKSSTISNTSTSLVLGGSQAGTPDFAGRILELLIYNRALSEQEIQDVQTYVNIKYLGLEVVDKSILRALVAEAETMKQSSYTESGWETLQARIVSAKAVLAKDAVRKAEVDAAYNALLMAMNAKIGSLPMNGLDLWLKADAGVTVGDGNRVTGWRNQADGAFAGLTLTAPASGYVAPATLMTDPSGYQYLQFSDGGYNSGGQDNACVLRTDNFKSYAGSSAMTVVAINLPEANRGIPDWPDQCTLLRIGNSSTPQVLFVSSLRGANISFSGDGSNGAYYGGSSTTISELSTMIAVKDGRAETVYVNGVQGNVLNRNATIASNTSTLSLGGKKGGALSYRGRVAEILIYDRALSAEELAQVQAYVDAKYFGIVPVDKTALVDAMANVEALVKNDWTAASWAYAEAAYGVALQVFADDDAMQADVDTAAGALQAAVDALEPLAFGLGNQPASVVLRKGMKFQLNIETNNPSSLVYISSNANATVDGNGLVTAVKTGSAVITVIDTWAQRYFTIAINITS